MHASAGLTVERRATGSGTTSTRISRLRSDPPLVLRRTLAAEPDPVSHWGLDARGAARVAVVSGAAGPVGGDDVHLDVDVGPGAALVLRAVAATIALPGPHGERSRSDVTVRVAADAALAWLPGTLIAAHGCDHHGTTTITLEEGARLLVREELLLGRHAEPCGSLRQRLRVVLAGRPIHDQELHVGAGAPGWDGPAVTGGRRAVGSVLLVDPTLPADGPAVVGPGDSARLPLCGPAVLVTALAEDALLVRSRLDRHVLALEALVEPRPLRDRRPSRDGPAAVIPVPQRRS